METLANWKRSCYCGQLRTENIGQTVIVMGWVQRQRDLGGLIFVDLRDREGVVQLAFDEDCPREAFEKASALRSEYVVAAKGIVRGRSAKNKDIPTGEVEIAAEELRVLSLSETPPFEIVENCTTTELTRLQYRYLDLRRPDLQKNIIMRHRVTKAARDYFDENGFIEIETPMMIKSTPEGARDYLVPSRIHKGSFYALPQSPQLYKQLSMVAGFDRYVQFARCFRDEDLRADRQPEFTQIDVEMSFVQVEDVLQIAEGMMAHVFRTVLGISLPLPFPRLTFKEAMERYGCDKPDTRYAMELCDLSDEVRDSGFTVFRSALEQGGSVRGITAKNAVNILTRKELDKLTEFLRGIGAKGLAWVRCNEDGTLASSFGKFLSEEEMQKLLVKMGAVSGDVALIVADSKNSAVFSALGALRVEVAKRLQLIPGGQFHPVWITEFPFFDWDEDTQQFVAMHHPFTSPMEECLSYLEEDKAKVRAKAYDLVLNGIELSSGSIRITDPTLQKRIFALLGFTPEEAQTKFGFLTDAFRYGAPPHGGFGLGLDRLVMQMLACESLRDVTAFPKVQNASEPMTQCPSPADPQQLKELGISLLAD